MTFHPFHQSHRIDSCVIREEGFLKYVSKCDCSPDWQVISAILASLLPSPEEQLAWKKLVGDAYRRQLQRVIEEHGGFALIVQQGQQPNEGDFFRAAFEAEQRRES